MHVDGGAHRRENERALLGPKQAGVPRPRRLLADWQAPRRLFVCVHGKWNGVAVAKALEPSISVTVGAGGVYGMCHLQD